MPELKLSKPLNQVLEVKNAIRQARKADQLTEHAVMRAFEVFRVLKFGQPAGPASALGRLDRATEQLGEARSALGDAVHQLERLLYEAGFTVPAKS